jgi:hypothetical protein
MRNIAKVEFRGNATDIYTEVKMKALTEKRKESVINGIKTNNFFLGNLRVLFYLNSRSGKRYE